MIQARDGRVHVTYSYHVAGAAGDGGQGKSIKHVSFDEACSSAADLLLHSEPGGRSLHREGSRGLGGLGAP